MSQKKIYKTKKEHGGEQILNKKETNTTKINSKNTPYLVIVESPSKCKKIEKYLGFQYKCIASKGHICGIEKVKKTYEPVFEILEEKKKHVENMREIISHFLPENIYLGTDDDREGEAIAWHICLVFGLSVETVHRIIFHEITESAIRAAVAFPMKIRMNIVNAQKARQVLDRLVGFQISPLLSKRIAHSDTTFLSAGRCQTPALRLIYDLEQSASKGEIAYHTTGYFFQQNLPTQLSHSFQVEQECITFLEESRHFEHKYTLGQAISKTTTAPLPFCTSSLLQYASSHLHFSPKQTMNYCQILYQNGWITYMRTESIKYSQDFVQKIKEYVTDSKWLGDLSKVQNYNENNPHEAIRITHLEKRVLHEKDFECELETRDYNRILALYDKIWLRTLESCGSNYQYKQIAVKITAPQEYHYLHTIEIPAFLGWKIWTTEEQEFVETQNKQNAIYFFLQNLANKITKPNKIDCKVGFGNKTRHYCEASLIGKLEDLGIGRPSTFASIVETVQERKYVSKQDIEGEKINCIEFSMEFPKGEWQRFEMERIMGQEKNKLVLQPLGKEVVEQLIPTFETLFSYDYTKKMETELDIVSNGELLWTTICQDCDKEIKKCSTEWKTEMKDTYWIDDEHELIFSKHGVLIRKKINMLNEPKKENEKDKSKYEYRQVRNIKIDITKLKNREYTLADLLEIPNECLGKYQGEDLFLKKGPYGAYVTWGENKESINNIKKNLWDITMDDILEYLFQPPETKLPPNVLRVLTDKISIRKGKFGPYIHYKSALKPEFYNLKPFIQSSTTSYMKCDKEILLKWIAESYGING